VEQIQELKTQRIGIDVWWDHKLQQYRSKRINLEKVSLEYRCPNCGEIVVKPRDRGANLIVDREDERIRLKEIRRVRELENPPKSEWDGFVEKHRELFTRKYITPEKITPIELSWYGGVCEQCYYDGFGKHGVYGKFLKTQLDKDRAKFEDRKNKVAIWINGELRLVDKVIDITHNPILFNPTTQHLFYPASKTHT